MTLTALEALSERVVSEYQAKYASLPFSEDLADWPSPCVSEEKNGVVYWQPVAQSPALDFSSVESAIDLTLHDDIKAFYTTQFCADIDATYNGHSLALIQLWNEEDWQRLQENILGHLVMQRRLKLSPTVFIASTDDDMQVVSICNVTGNVLLEPLGAKKREVLAENVSLFLQQLIPVVE